MTETDFSIKEYLQEMREDLKGDIKSIKIDIVKIIESNAVQDVEIKTVKKEICDHKDTHRYWTGIMITVSSMIGGVASYFVNKVKGQ